MANAKRTCKAKGRVKRYRKKGVCWENWKCDKPIMARGYCSAHYNAILDGAEELRPVGTGNRKPELDAIFAKFED